MLTGPERDAQDRLKATLEAGVHTKLEQLAAALLGRLLGVTVAVAKSGFQHGGDAGSAGRQGRRLRIETKRYADSTSFSGRELLGEIDQALARDQALEAWVLVSTREVPEQLEQDLLAKGESVGVPIVIVDWKADGLASLAALCASDPDPVETLVSKDAGALARTLQPIARDAIEKLRRDLKAWCLGFEALRAASHDHLTRIWTVPRTSKAELGQDAAGGAHPRRIRRLTIHAALDAWWSDRAPKDAPAAVIGWDGVGKTWATLTWLVDHLNDQPIVLVVPSSAATGLGSVSVVALKAFLAGRLHEITAVRDLDHWLRRFDRLLQRPRDEGPVLTVFFDGMNEQPSVPWLKLLGTLQDEPFDGRARVLVSTRNHYFEQLAQFRSLDVQAVVTPLDVYDTTPGGELDQMLAFEGLKQSDLHPDLIPFARTPRLFSLVVRFRDRLVDAGQVTVHRLLWEYGRDSLGTRAGRSFSEDEWRAWLREIAQRYRTGTKCYTLKTLGETADHPDLDESRVYARLSDIVDGQFVKRGPAGAFQLVPTVVDHALGLELLDQIDGLNPPTFETAYARLSQWLDPIGGLDQRAEILRAAVSILVERGLPTADPIASALVTAWLQTQNIPDEHRDEVARLAVELTEPLLDAVEHSAGAQASARLWAVNALRAIPRNNVSALRAIVARARRWLSVVSRDLAPPQMTNADWEKRRAKRLIDRVGADKSGPMAVLGVQIEFVDRDPDTLAAVAPRLLEGYPLASATLAFETAALNLAIRGYYNGWDGLKWLCLFNDGDPAEAAVAIRRLSGEVAARLPEPGVNPCLPARVGALLLWLTGEDADDERAVALDPGIDRSLTYEMDYLSDPGRSFLPLERQHAEAVLNDKTLPLHVRMQRTKELWFDPTFHFPDAFAAELREAMNDLNVDALGTHMSPSIEDHNFEELEPVLARCAPDLLARLIRRKLAGFATRSSVSRHLSALHAINHLILVDESSAEAARALRRRGRESRPEEAFDASDLLAFEIIGQPAFAQAVALMEADLDSIADDVGKVLRPLTAAEIELLIEKYGSGTSKQIIDLVLVLSFQGGPIFDAAWGWLSARAFDEAFQHRGLAFKILTQIDAARFGRDLQMRGWSWSPQDDFWMNHYGSTALMDASLGMPFDQVAHRLAPWRLLAAVRSRGGVASETQLAAAIFGTVMAGDRVEPPNQGSRVSNKLSNTKGDPFALSSRRPAEQGPGDPLSAGAAIDVEAQASARERAFDTAIERIKQARASRADLYLANVAAEDFEPILQYASEAVDSWVEGAAERTVDFMRRVHLAEGAYLALCEALLRVAPEKGTMLWRSLKHSLHTRFVGVGQVDELSHMAFRAPASAAADGLLADLLGLASANTDRGLLDLAIAATANGRTAWLGEVIRDDATSGVAWRRRRAVVLSGFGSGSVLPVEGAWPSGAVSTDAKKQSVKAARLRSIEACARHWWREYTGAPNAETAYAAWILLLSSADRRAWIWLSEEANSLSSRDDLSRFKRAHVQLNKHELERAMKERESNLDKTFLGRDIVNGIGPWRED